MTGALRAGSSVLRGNRASLKCEMAERRPRMQELLAGSALPTRFPATRHPPSRPVVVARNHVPCGTSRTTGRVLHFLPSVHWQLRLPSTAALARGLAPSSTLDLARVLLPSSIGTAPERLGAGQCSHGWPAERRAGRGPNASGPPCSVRRRRATSTAVHVLQHAAARDSRPPTPSSAPATAAPASQGRRSPFGHLASHGASCTLAPLMRSHKAVACVPNSRGGQPPRQCANHRARRGTHLRDHDMICALACTCPDGQRGRETSKCPSASTLDSKLPSTSS